MVEIEIQNQKGQEEEEQEEPKIYIYLKEVKNQKGQEEDIDKIIKESIKTEIIRTITGIMDKIVEDAKMQKIRLFRLAYEKYYDLPQSGNEDIEKELSLEDGLYFTIETIDGLKSYIKLVKQLNGDYLFIVEDSLKKEQVFKNIRYDGLDINLKKLFEEITEKYYHKLREIALMNAIKEYNQKFNKNISINDIELDKSKLIILKPFLAEIGSKYYFIFEHKDIMGFYLCFKDIDFKFF